MKINQEVLALDVTSSATQVMNFNGNKNGDVVTSEMYINTLSNCTVVVKGYVDAADTTGITLKCVDVANLEKKDSVTAAGNYCYLVGSYYKVSIAITGTSKVIIKCLY